ncbi:threonine--tRNA ligase [Paractinoplanes rishiriensis]|uniref:Threonine--tRNA ligase n=1 Tax=Paractinoplanes rishiriensis TaxID=1050105 RepID=A0A919JUN5_9ACTN|nr:threonine--tRNA ligase [Actinoplanes rishiriensis]GIE93737.1 threonine--tRNA ligase [Actinoplanes rishiriensis]
MHIDHRKLGRELDLFDSDPLIGAGLPFWLPAGAAARHEVESYLYELERRHGYRHVYSPALGKRQMYEISGHWQNFADDMFPPMRLGGDELVLRPSLCPHHALLVKSRQRSYRELPLRIAELGPMYRAERSGVLGGLARVRSIQLNDAHIFCALDQVGDEVAAVLRLMDEAHAALGLSPTAFRLSLRGEGGKYGGGDAMWERAEALLRAALAGIPFEEVRGEAAFYGPKIDVQIVDPAGREWSLATIQVDFLMPERFGLEYSAADGGRHRPVMVHRSLAGSMERLFGHLIEVHGGAFPVWYAPVQLDVLPIGADQSAAASAFAAEAIRAGLRAEVHHDGSIGARIRAAAERKVPYVAVLGAREVADGSVALRLRDGRQLPPRPAAEAIALVASVASPFQPPRRHP